jgi:hypothetical protein
MPRNEAKPDKVEKKRPSLDDRLIEKGEDLQRQLVFSGTDFTPHLEILSLVHIARQEYETLSLTDQRKLKRMLGLQMRITPATTKTAGDDRFWAEVDSWAKEEIVKAAQFADDLNDMPKSWQPALNGLAKLQDALKIQRGEQ